MDVLTLFVCICHFIHFTDFLDNIFTGLKVYFSGNGKSYWDVRKGKHTTKYRARETYLNHFMTLYGSGISTVSPAFGNKSRLLFSSAEMFKKPL